MLVNTRKVILYISMSLDGFIATKDDDLSFLDAMQNGTEDYGYHDFIANVDTYIVGRKTYDKVVSMIGEFPQRKDFDRFVVTRNRSLKADDVRFYSEDLSTLIQGLKEKEGKNIYCDGGGEIVKILMEKDLIDEYIVSIIPTILGDGKRLFQGIENELNIELIESKTYEKGLVQLKYKRIRD